TDLEMLISETGAATNVAILPTVVGDSRQLGQLFQNLLSNAIKFRQTSVRPIINIRSTHVTCLDLPEDIKPSRAAVAYHRIDVADNGIGFEQRYAHRIFQVFQRLHGKSHYAGTGIGLAICKKVVANHGGDIVASSQPGQGATFSIYLPF
ncbi:MAG: PAS domain-containing sensor histidine kinase, partial [Cytophagaceae bacterium]